jgi:iron complex outermembrane receptor protein
MRASVSSPDAENERGPAAVRARTRAEALRLPSASIRESIPPARRVGTRRRAGVLLAATVASLVLAASAMANEQPANDLGDLSLEQLGNVDITSVSRRSERLSDAPASIYVISNDDIRRSGATTLPEALRLAPNLEVARVSASDYAISARGFNNALGNKLLVLIDGRTVYTPLFSGVFWDAQDVVLEDVDRIEVISGPGATLWGANAVNGVINVITRSAAKTQGTLVSIQGGGEDNSGVVRYGGRFDSGGYFRVYAKRDVIEDTQTTTGEPITDGGSRDQVGFRADWGDADDGFTVQGDGYGGQFERTLFGPVAISGMNVLADWNRRETDGSSMQVQAYFDRTVRNDPLEFRDQMDVVDVQFQRDTPLASSDIVWGGGYRYARDDATKGLLATFIPGLKDLNWENLFAQDEIALEKTLKLTLGLRLDRNTYTGTEFLPNLRLAWKPGDDQLVWGSLSRAVRAPSRIDREFFFPGNPPYLITGGPDFVSEVSDVAEVGYRVQPTKRISFSVTGFYQYYENLRSGEPQPDGSFQVENGTAGRATGIETWTTLDLTGQWRVAVGLTELRQTFWTRRGFHDPDGSVDLGNDPNHQWSLRSTFDITPKLEFDVMTRSVAQLPAPVIPAYTAVDASSAWRPNTHLELSLFLQNLFDAGHVEFAPGAFALLSDYDRSAAVRVQWQW